MKFFVLILIFCYHESSSAVDDPQLDEYELEKSHIKEFGTFFTTDRKFWAEYNPKKELNSEDIDVDALQTSEGRCLYSNDVIFGYTCRLTAQITSPDQVLTITGNHLPGRTDADVEHVQHGFSTIRFFNGEILRRFPNLRTIDLRLTYLEFITNDAFSMNCGQLVGLNLELNNIKALPNGMLSNCSNLIVFTARSNQIRELPQDLFGLSEKLNVFDLSVNSLTTIPPNLLQNMHNLIEFDISSNEIGDAQPIMQVLNGHTNLLRIGIIENSFTNYDFTTLSQFQQLLEIHLNANQGNANHLWTALSPTLLSLRIMDNNANIPENALNRFVNLINLELSGTGLTTLHRNTFRELRNLQTLNFFNTNFNSLDSEVFAHQTNLRSFSIFHDGRLDRLPDGIFSGLGNLGNGTESLAFEIKWTKIRSLSMSMFGNHPHLRRVSFEGNEINRIQRGLFERFNPNMAYVELRKNRCVNNAFFDADDLNSDSRLEQCFQNYENLPDGSGIIFKRTEVLWIIFAGMLWNLMNY